MISCFFFILQGKRVSFTDFQTVPGISYLDGKSSHPKRRYRHMLLKRDTAFSDKSTSEV